MHHQRGPHHPSKGMHTPRKGKCQGLSCALSWCNEWSSSWPCCWPALNPGLVLRTRAVCIIQELAPLGDIRKIIKEAQAAKRQPSEDVVWKVRVCVWLAVVCCVGTRRAWRVMWGRCCMRCPYGCLGRMHKQQDDRLSLLLVADTSPLPPCPPPGADPDCEGARGPALAQDLASRHQTRCVYVSVFVRPCMRTRACVHAAWRGQPWGGLRSLNPSEAPTH